MEVDESHPFLAFLLALLTPHSGLSSASAGKMLSFGGLFPAVLTASCVPCLYLTVPVCI